MENILLLQNVNRITHEPPMIRHTQVHTLTALHPKQTVVFYLVRIEGFDFLSCMGEGPTGDFFIWCLFTCNQIHLHEKNEVRSLCQKDGSIRLVYQKLQCSILLWFLKSFECLISDDLCSDLPIVLLVVKTHNGCPLLRLCHKNCNLSIRLIYTSSDKPI